jgi:hypothetical protein
MTKLKSVIEAAKKSEALRDTLVKEVPYLDFTISVYSVESERFGTLYWAENDIGEPYTDGPTMYKDMNKAVAEEKKNIETYVRENK